MGRDEFCGVRAGAKMLGISTTSFYKIVATGEVRIQQWPGLKPRYAISDIRKILDREPTRAIRPAGSRGAM
jgi:hypothetical protein